MLETLFLWMADINDGVVGRGPYLLRLPRDARDEEELPSSSSRVTELII
jgi:hypothetical protein